MRYSNNWPSCTYDLETDEGEGIGWSDERFQTIAQVNVLSGEDGSDDQIRGILTIDQVHVHPGDTRRKWLDDQVRGIQTIDQFLVLSGDEWGGRWWSDETVFKLTKFTYELKTHEEDVTLEVFKQLTKFTYDLETDEEEGVYWSDERYCYWPSSLARTSWRGRNRMIK